MPVVELGLDVRHDLDPVHYEIGNQAVYLGVLHDHADQPGPAEVALAELGASEVLVIEASHANRLGSGLVVAEWHPNRMLRSEIRLPRRLALSSACARTDAVATS